MQITAAALGPDQKRLATLAVRTSNDSLQPVFKPESDGYLSNPPILRVWDVSKGTPLAEMELKATMTRFHKIQYLGQKLVIFMHLKWQDALTTEGELTLYSSFLSFFVLLVYFASVLASFFLFNFPLFIL